LKIGQKLSVFWLMLSGSVVGIELKFSVWYVLART